MIKLSFTYYINDIVNGIVMKIQRDKKKLGSPIEMCLLGLFSAVNSRWQFMSDGADIGFGIYLKTKVGARQHAGEMAEVYPNQRYNAHLVPEDGSLTCPDAGICE